MKDHFFRSFYLALTFLVVNTPGVLFAKNNPPKTATKAAQKSISLGEQLARIDYKSQEKLIKKALLASPDSAILHFRLASLALKLDKSSSVRALIPKFLDSALGQNAALMATFLAELPVTDQGFLAEELSKRGVLLNSPPSLCPFFELDLRRERGSLLSLMAQGGSLEEESKHKIWRELYLRLPETLSLATWQEEEDFKSWQRSLSVEDFLLRINNLLLFGNNLEAKQSYELALLILKNLSASDRCALEYESAKIERKMRHYQEARKRFSNLAKRCDSDIKQKSRYMDLQLAALTGDRISLLHFDSFVADYPTHGFSDDVLLFKANLLLDSNEQDQALVTLNQLIKEYPKGDMIERALFLKAFTLAKMAKSEQAIVSLKELKNIAAPGSLEEAQARYWIARLGIFSDLKVVDGKNKARGSRSELMALAKADNPTVYSWLAFKLLKELGVKVHVASLKKKPSVKKVAFTTASLKYIDELVDQGFSEEALALLNEEALDANEQDKLVGMASLYIKIGQPEAGHQKLIRCNEKLALLLKKLAPHIYDEISWPKPFLAHVGEASSRLKVPSILINSVMRQESGFLSKARSWAQARGAMQLVEATANEHAKLLGLKKIAPDDLFDPKLNILLGSSVLNKYGQNFGHIVLALSAYNAGPVSARKWQRANKGLPIDTFIEEIPFKETRSYVKAVMGTAINYAIRDNAKLLDGDFRLASQ